MGLWLRAFTPVCKHRTPECWEGRGSKATGLAARVCKLLAWLPVAVCCFKNTGLWSGGQGTAGGPDNLISSSCLTRLPNPFCSTSRVRFRVRRARCNRKPVTQSRTLNASYTYYWKACWARQQYLCSAVPSLEFQDKTGGFKVKEDSTWQAGYYFRFDITLIF